MNSEETSETRPQSLTSEPSDETTNDKTIIDAIAEILKRKSEAGFHSDLSNILKNCLETYSVKHEFKRGDLVKWKPMLKDRLYPELDSPAIVIEVLEKPIIDLTNDSGSPYFREAYDMIVGVLNEKDKVFLKYHLSSLRLEPYK